MSPRRSTLQAVQDLSRHATVVEVLCKCILLGGRWDGAHALDQLPEALRHLSLTIAQTEAALAMEDQP